MMTTKQIIDQFYGEFAAGNLDGVFDLLSDDIRWELVGSQSIPYFGVYKGKDGVATFFNKLFEHEEVLDFEVDDIVVEGIKGTVIGHEHCKAKSTGKEFKVKWVHIFDVQDGLVTSWTEIIDTNDMVIAYGVE